MSRRPSSVAPAQQNRGPASLEQLIRERAEEVIRESQALHQKFDVPVRLRVDGLLVAEVQFSALISMARLQTRIMALTGIAPSQQLLSGSGVTLLNTRDLHRHICESGKLCDIHISIKEDEQDEQDMLFKPMPSAASTATSGSAHSAKSSRSMSSASTYRSAASSVNSPSSTAWGAGDSGSYGPWRRCQNMLQATMTSLSSRSRSIRSQRHQTSMVVDGICDSIASSPPPRTRAQSLGRRPRSQANSNSFSSLWGS